MIVGDLHKLAICVAASIVGHYAFAKGLEQLPARETAEQPRTVEIRVTTPPPAPPPEPEPPPEPIKPPEPAPEPPKQVHERPRPTKVAASVPADVPKDTPPVEHAVTTESTTTTPTFGVTMESTSQGGGPPVQVGNTTRVQPSARPVTQGEVKPLAAPAAAVDVTKMPMPQGRCSGKYTAEALAQAIEGVVVLDLIVDETGRARDIQVVDGLGGGLTNAALAALADCRFTPGEKDGKPVAVRVRGFKIRFVLPDGR
jgi:protein TonB